MRIVARLRPISRYEIVNVQFFCVARPALSIEVQKLDVRKSTKLAVRHARRMVKNMRGLYV